MKAESIVYNDSELVSQPDSLVVDKPVFWNLLKQIGKSLVLGHLEKLPYCKRTKAESAALP